MITIYSPTADDFSTLGLGALAPYEVIIEEEAGGLYELTMTHPMDEGGKWLNIGPGCIIKAPAPVRETPLAEEDAASEPVTVTRKIYKVQTNTGANLHLRQGPSTSTKILSKYRPGTEVAVLSQSGGWGKVIVCRSGATGYMSMQYLVYVRDETETVSGDGPSPERVIYPVQSRGQLFRIVSVERDAAEHEVRVTARHIFYDLLGNLVKNDYAPEGVAANTVVNQIFDRALNAHEFDVHCQVTDAVTGEYTRRGIVECLLDPDDGVVPQAGARLIRDNYDIWILPDMDRETGVTIRHGKNLLGATMTTDHEDVVTRIIPVGQTKDGKPLLLDGTIYVDSPLINDYPVICAQAIEYDVKVGQDGIGNATQARAKLRELAQADFADNGVDKPTIGLDVDFVALGETEEYKAYADLEAVHLYDTVRVIAKNAGIDAAVRVTGYKWDALGRRYEGVTLGEIADLKPTVYSYEIPRGAIKTIKIANGAIGSAQLRDLAVQYAHINTAAVEQLSANSITALKAYIHELVAESVTTDQLYADIATIALAQITTANIENANIDWAQIGTLSADIATIAKAHLTDADIDWAQIANLTAAVAEIAQVEIGEAVIDGAQITDGTITNAKIENGAIDTAKIALGAITTALIATGAVGTAQIADGSITDAKIVSLNADVINAGTLSVDRLLLKGPDGLFVAINATDEGLTSEQLSQEEYQSAISGSVLVARSVTADKIAAKSITANEIAAGAITTAELAAESVDASKIKAGSITTSHVAANFGETLDISSNEQVEIIAGNVQQAQETADSAQEAAEKAAPIEGDGPPEEAPEAGRLWLDTGVEPSVLRRWRGADVTTARAFAYTVQGCGKNLLPPIASTTVAGITYQNRGDGTYLANGTCTGVNALELFRGVLPPGRYTLSGSDSDLKVQVSVYNAAGSWVRVLAVSSDYQPVCTFTVDDLREGEAYHKVFFQAEPTAVGQTFANVILSPQLERGETGTDFEPYEDIPLIALDNGQGQLSQIAVEAGCTASVSGSTITGRESVAVLACGKNLLNASNATENSAVSGLDADGTVWISADLAISWYMNAPIAVMYVTAGKTYRFSLSETTSYGRFALTAALISGDDMFQAATPITRLDGAESTYVGADVAYCSFRADYTGALYVIYCSDDNHASGTQAFGVQMWAVEGETATAFEAYEDMGGGTIAPTSPLYGLPLAMDSVEIDADGDVLVTHRTGAIVLNGTETWDGDFTNTSGGGLHYAYTQVSGIRPYLDNTDDPAIICSHFDSVGGNAGWGSTVPVASRSANNDYHNTTIRFYTDMTSLSDWTAYLAAQASAGTPVTVVYELAAPTAEALTAVPPIAPQPGTVNLITGGDRLTAEISGSGWQVVNDTSDVRAALSGVDGDLAALASEVGLLEGQVGSIAEQIITPDGVKSIVLDSDEYRLLAQQASLTADGLSVTQTTVENLDGRVETLESGVHIAGAEIGIYASDSPFRMQIDNTGWEITQDGQSTISARESKIVAPRVQVTDALMLGSLAVKSSEGCLRLLKYSS